MKILFYFLFYFQSLRWCRVYYYYVPAWGDIYESVRPIISTNLKQLQQNYINFAIVSINFFWELFKYWYIFLFIGWYRWRRPGTLCPKTRRRANVSSINSVRWISWEFGVNFYVFSKVLLEISVKTCDRLTTDHSAMWTALTAHVTPPAGHDQSLSFILPPASDNESVVSVSPSLLNTWIFTCICLAPSCPLGYACEIAQHLDIYMHVSRTCMSSWLCL